MRAALVLLILGMSVGSAAGQRDFPRYEAFLDHGLHVFMDTRTWMRKAPLDADLASVAILESHEDPNAPCSERAVLGEIPRSVFDAAQGLTVELVFPLKKPVSATFLCGRTRDGKLVRDPMSAELPEGPYGYQPRVLTPSGPINIWYMTERSQEIAAVGFDPGAGTFVETRLHEHHRVRRGVRVTLENGAVIEAPAELSFYLPLTRGYRAAGELRQGDALFDESLANVRVAAPPVAGDVDLPVLDGSYFMNGFLVRGAVPAASRPFKKPPDELVSLSVAFVATSSEGKVSIPAWLKARPLPPEVKSVALLMKPNRGVPGALEPMECEERWVKKELPRRIFDELHRDPLIVNLQARDGRGYSLLACTRDASGRLHGGHLGRDIGVPEPQT